MQHIMHGADSLARLQMHVSIWEPSKQNVACSALNERSRELEAGQLELIHLDIPGLPLESQRRRKNVF